VVRAALAEAASTTLERIEAGGDGASAEDRVI
jgi:hypothetical protein